MATVHCDNFVGNAWKKDLCLNCFKSKEEHAITNGHSNPVVPTRILDPPKEGILKGTKSGNQTTKGSKVIFLNKEYEIIGFGGDDDYSDEEDYPDTSCNRETEDADLEDSEEDKAFQKLTKSNTDFNSIPENLQEPKEGEVKKIIEPLKLGKQVFDDKGNKKTLLVSVTPFGDQTSIKNKINVNLIKTTNMVAKEIKVNRVSDSEKQKKDVKVPVKIKSGEEKSEINSNGDNAKENVNFLNGEITLKEKSENSVEMNGDDSSNKAGNDKSLKRSQPLDKNFKFRVSKDLQKENEKNIEMNGKEDNKIKTSDKVNSLIDKAKKKVNQFPVIADNSNFKFKTKDFMNENLKKVSENNKAVVLDMYNIREKEDVKIHNEINGEKAVKKIIVLPEMRNHILSADVKINKSTVEDNNDKKEKVKNDFRVEQEIKATSDTPRTFLNETDTPQKNLILDRNKLVPNVSTLYRHHFKNVLAKSDEEEKNKIEDASPIIKPTMKKLIGSMSLVPNLEYTFSEADRTIGDEVSETKENCSDVKEDIITREVQKVEIIGEKDGLIADDKFKSSFNSFENFKSIIKGEEITLFSAENEVANASYDKEKQTDREKNGVPEISRESAGEPDGRADSDDLSEPPALPLKPPPPLTESRTSFLQDLPVVDEAAKMGISDKPKVPVKPLKIQSKKTNFLSPLHTNRPKSPSMEKFLDSTSSPQVKAHLPLQESLSSDSSTNQKRPAPKPPSPKEDASKKFVNVLSDEKPFETTLNQSETENSDILRISRSTENLLEIITSQDEKDKLTAEGLEEITVPEPVPRKTLSRSQDSLVVSIEPEEAQAKKKPSRGRFFLRKLLHLGKSKEVSGKDLNSTCPRSSLPPAPKPKLEIIHPIDLNGTRVEVVPPARTSKSRRTSSSASSSSGEQRESDVLSDSSTSHSMSSSGNDSQSTIDRNKKPPPPPRAHSMDTWNAKPARPPPPKSIHILRQANTSWNTAVETKPDNLYVNLGEARIGLAPHKPMRTGSLREVNMDTSKRLVTVSTQPEDSDYESFIVSSAQNLPPSPQLEDNLYECVQGSNYRSSLPECDSSMTDNSEYTKGKQSSTCRNISHRRSEGNVDLNSDTFKMKFLRSVSMPYCASETESEIYSPYSFYGSELGEDDYDSSSATHSLRMSRLKLKKGRSIVHKNLEDNYGAVIIANHEALAQVVEQMRQGPSTPPALRGLSTSANLRWTDFVIAKDEPGVVVERRVFYPALWGTHSVTLSVMAEQSLNSSLHAKGPFNLNPITELNDLVPASYLPMLKKNNSDLIQASISILTRLQIETIETYGINKSKGILNEESKKEINFVLLQIINAFKSLQAQGIEEAPKNLSNLVVCREEKDPHPRICIIHSTERSNNETSLCQCLIHAIKNILPSTDLTPLISNVLLKEKAVSLSQAKAILEFSLWGPSDIAFGNSSRERESALQRWLDLERATVLHGLVRTRAELTVFEEWQLLFLVRTSAKMLADASLVLEDNNTENISTA